MTPSTITTVTVTSPTTGLVDECAGSAEKRHEYLDGIVELQDSGMLPSDLRARLATFRFVA